MPLLLAGPTAVGKSAIALELAERLKGELISVDSMQVYRGLDIGTAKATAVERARVPHHLIDVVDLTASFDAAEFVRLANAAMVSIQDRGRIPILCGGTGLYFQALLEGLGSAPPADPLVRAELEAQPLAELLQHLQKLDPATYSQVDRSNRRRVVRALEVIRLTGKPFGEQRAHWGRRTTQLGLAARGPQSVAFFGLERSADDLRKRIDSRLERMFGDALVAEVQDLAGRGLRLSRSASQALGYRQILEYLDGVRSLEATRELVKRRTRQYAKRQMTWFRRQTDIRWIRIEETEEAAAVAERISRLYAELATRESPGLQ